MKKSTLYLFILLAVISLKVNAQFSAGPKVGYNLSMITDTTSAGYKGVLNTGFSYGAVVNYTLNENLSLQPEILYSVKGAKEVNGESFNQLILNYIEVPILAKYTFGKKAFKGYVEAGPYVAYWLSGKINYRIVEWEMEGNDNYKFEDMDLGATKLKDNRLDIGLNVGFGGMYAFGPGNFMVDARYGYGLSNINKYTGEELPGWVNKKNRVMTISAGYLFNIGK